MAEHIFKDCKLGHEEENEENEDKITMAQTMGTCYDCFKEEGCPGCPVYGIIRSIRDNHLA